MPCGADPLRLRRHRHKRLLHGKPALRLYPRGSLPLSPADELQQTDAVALTFAEPPVFNFHRKLEYRNVGTIV
jgi:hypothetical protein